jgi:hypothetical protein
MLDNLDCSITLRNTLPLVPGRSPDSRVKYFQMDCLPTHQRSGWVSIATRLPLRGQCRVCCEVYKKSNAPASRFILQTTVIRTPETVCQLELNAERYSKPYLCMFSIDKNFILFNQ